MRISFLLCAISFTFFLSAQNFTKQDSLRGNLSVVRSCFDVYYYDLFLILDIEEKSIERSYNDIYFTALSDLDSIQVDLAANMDVQLIEYEGNALQFSREFDAIFITFPQQIKKGERVKIKVWYSGYPRIAVHPPWDGGFSWEKDKNGKNWIGVSCQGLGASAWWPCKDHQSDEPDSMQITCSTVHPNKIISNGNLRKDTLVWNDYLQNWLIQSQWFVSYPINNYDVTINIGDYIHLSDQYISNNDTLDLSYYILSYNKEKAIQHFEQVKPMLKCFETYFGRYPFWKDGYALVETPFLGMEHQSAIAYGNDYLSGYHGNKQFIAGLDFDFIIVHESGHEWWGNSITTNDIADMWVQEGFCTYAEVLYVECLYGYETMLKYVNNQKKGVRNDKPVIGPYHVNKEGSGDMYNKASLMLHTLRTLLEDDELWFEIIKGLYTKFQYQTVDGQEVLDYINQKSKKDFTEFFNQYLKNKDIPEFQYKLIKQGREITLLYRWEAIDGFDMPLLTKVGGKRVWIYPTNQWNEKSLGLFDMDEFEIEEELFFINIKKVD